MFLRPSLFNFLVPSKKITLKNERLLLWGEDDGTYLQLWGDEDGYLLLWGDENLKAWFLYNDGFRLSGEWIDSIEF